ncbi:MAG: D-alanine--D-alanine ligase family protein [Pseudomonadota bacterium]
MKTQAANKAYILHGVTQTAPSADERDTLIQADEVATALHALGFAPEILAVTPDLGILGQLRAAPPALIFNLVEALGGDGRHAHVLAAALEANGLAFSGAPAKALLLSSDKPLAKRVMRASAIPTPDWLEATSGQCPDPAQFYIVKSVWEHASFGLDARSVVPGKTVRAELAARQAKHGGDWFAERYIDGREFNLALLHGPEGPEILPIAEMTFVGFPPERPRILDYAAKWDETDFAYHHTPRRFDLPAEDASLLMRMRALACACWDCFALAGYARVDFRVDAAGQPWVLEVNANPCLSQDAGFMAAAGRAGLSQTQVVARIIAAAGIAVRAAA